MENLELTANRLSELAARAEKRGIWVYSEFLTLAEQNIALSLKLRCPFELWGGVPEAERKIACFGSEDLCGWRQEPPVVCVKLQPASQKFAEPLSHRDFLGSLMALGIRREVLGDIIITENTGYLLCLESIAGYVADSLTRVRHTAVRCSLSEPPAKPAEKPEQTELVVASERLDALVAAVFHLSRSQAQELVASERVFLSGYLASNPSVQVPVNTVVSVRGIGRFIYQGIMRETKKGRIRVIVCIYS